MEDYDGIVDRKPLNENRAAAERLWQERYEKNQLDQKTKDQQKKDNDAAFFGGMIFMGIIALILFLFYLWATSQPTPVTG